MKQNCPSGDAAGTLHKLLELVVGLDLVDDGADDLEGAAVLAVVGRDDEVDALLPEQFLGEGLLAGILRVVNGDGLASEHGHYLHARDVGLPVAEIDHLRIGDPLLVLGHAVVDLLVVMGAEYPLAYLEDELGLGSVVHGYTRPDSLTGLVVDVGAGEYVLELGGDGGALDDFLQA